MSVKIHGKNYVTVDERVEEFHKRFPNGSIQTELIRFEGGIAITKTHVYPDIENSTRKFTGYAYEEVGSSNINKFSALENCETSSCGRALGFLGIGLNGSIATADEVANAVHKQNVGVVTNEQKERYQEYLQHKYFDGKRNETNKWWLTLKSEKAAESGLVFMLKRINEYNEKKGKKVVSESK